MRSGWRASPTACTWTARLGAAGTRGSCSRPSDRPAGCTPSTWTPRRAPTAAACYASLAAVAIGYDEIFPVYAKTSRSLGGLDMSGKEIGTVLIVGGFALVAFQTTLFPKIVAHFGVTKAGGLLRTGTRPA